MNTVALNSGFPRSKKREKATEMQKKKAKADTAFDREAIDRALDESINEKGEVLVYEVDMKDPENSIRKIMAHTRRTK